MKKEIVLLSLLVLTACTSIPSNQPTELPKGTIRDLLTESKETSQTEEKQEEMKEEKFVLEAENISTVLASVREEVKANQKLNFDEKVKKTNILVGQSVNIKDTAGIQDLKMTLSPRRANYTLKKQGNTIVFRSIYQGTYLITWKNLLGVSRQIQISNQLKYKFTEAENYAIISRNFQAKNLKTLEDGVSLYQIAFPEGKYLRESMLLWLKLATEKGNQKSVKENLHYWNQLQGFSTSEETAIQNAKKLLGEESLSLAGTATTESTSGNNSAEYESFKNLYQAANRKATVHLYESAVSDYLAALAINHNFQETSAVYQGLGNVYFGLGKYQESVNSFEKALATQSEKERRERGAEIYYKLASAYHKLGKQVEYKKYLTTVKEKYPNTLWGRKAAIEFMKLH